MRTPRIVILVLFISASLFILYRSLTSPARTASSRYPSRAQPSKAAWGLLYFNTPFSLFPPNAAISLTDDNSTSFAARPAAFGPRLDARGLSGQLWVGSGFAEDSLDGNGELGCSDVSGWDGGDTRASLRQTFQAIAPPVPASNGRPGHPKRDDTPLDSPNTDKTTKTSGESGATTNSHSDAFLARRDTSVSTSHADIQSIQEGAEIQGKVVLLMRGGCGFLEKVMWAQRRGAVAVIVGDNQRGGPLIQMFAHGEEVENVTVPSVFTARTTAQLLSSLTQPGSFIEDTLDDNGKPVLKVQQGTKSTKGKSKKNPDAAPAKPPVPSKKLVSPTTAKRSVKNERDRVKSAGWFSRFFSWNRSSRTTENGSRPPSSGRLDWVMVEDWDDEKDTMIKNSLAKTKKPFKPTANDDDFVIGVQDWRDPDLTGKSGSGSKKGKASTSFKQFSPETNGPKGGSITPGSGQYDPSDASFKDGRDAGSKASSKEGSPPSKGHGIMYKLFGDDAEDFKPTTETASTDIKNHNAEALPVPNNPDMPHHDGLWVTITPTSSASPFFDTLLVLVISPLVTLTIVYALLILRARIRRRRWRAPKSVVDRLPVRTYRTVVPSPTMSPRLPSPSSASPTTPLLQHSPPRPRPRSRTTTGVLESGNFLSPSPALPTPRAPSRNSARLEFEKGSGGFSAEWRKYMGRQVECVVCLEEYVDGVSKVMSLPCGHEFHVDCM